MPPSLLLDECGIHKQRIGRFFPLPVLWSWQTITPVFSFIFFPFSIIISNMICWHGLHARSRIGRQFKVLEWISPCDKIGYLWSTLKLFFHEKHPPLALGSVLIELNVFMSIEFSRMVFWGMKVVNWWWDGIFAPMLYISLVWFVDKTEEELGSKMIKMGGSRQLAMLDFSICLTSH
jgi:hypothetical protein